MSFQTYEAILKKLTDLYNKSPIGWKIAINQDSSGFYNIYVLTPKGLYQIKLESLSIPAPLGLGTKIGGIKEARKVIGRRIPDYGFRTLSQKELKIIIEALAKNKPSILGEVINRVLKAKPTKLPQKNFSALLEGPVIYLNKEVFVSRKQRELDEKLRRNLKKLMYKEGRYMGYV